MDSIQPLKSSISFKCISKMKILYFLSSLVVLLYLLLVIIHHKERIDVSNLSQVEREYRKRFNLMDGPAEIGKECTLDYINEQKLEQDHPCVIKLIREFYMSPPSSHDVPYNLTNVTPGFVQGVRNGKNMEAFLLKNKKRGFFVECGAFDGFFLTNTLELEMNDSWTGLLIEASPTSYKKLLTRNRKAWTSNVCLSLMPYPTKIGFTSYESPVVASQALFHVVETDEEDKAYTSITDHSPGDPFDITNRKTIKIQCFPLYSLLLATNQQTAVDYFSLDVEGWEKRVLETIPWNKVDIKMMRVETEHIPMGKNNQTGSDALKEFLEGEPGYVNFKIDQTDEIYIKKVFD